MLTEAEDVMNQHKITSLLVKEAGQLVGIIQIYDF
jgi:arabinose-5-phosphate isomerase